MGTYSFDIYVTHMIFVKFLPVVENMSKVAAAGISFFAAGAIIVIVWLGSKHLLRKSKLYLISVGIWEVSGST